MFRISVSLSPCFPDLELHASRGEDGEMVIEPFLDSDHIATISEDDVPLLNGFDAIADQMPSLQALK